MMAAAKATDILSTNQGLGPLFRLRPRRREVEDSSTMVEGEEFLFSWGMSPNHLTRADRGPENAIRSQGAAPHVNHKGGFEESTLRRVRNLYHVL